MQALVTDALPRDFFRDQRLAGYLDMRRLNDADYQNRMQELTTLPKGGFEHGDVAGMYVTHQACARWGQARYAGWMNLLHVALDRLDVDTPIVVDFLAGGGTLARHARALVPHHNAQVLGIDVSEQMCMHAQQRGEWVMWGRHNAHLIKRDIADVAVAAYGLHHVDVSERAAFVQSMVDVLHDDGRCVLHDFEHGSATARWYSDVIHRFRVGGHDFMHFDKESLLQLLVPHFRNVRVMRIYDPFYVEAMPGQSDIDLRREFFAYLIGFFSLSGLLPVGCDYQGLSSYHDPSFWAHVEAEMQPCFRISDAELSALHLKQGGPSVVKEITLAEGAGGVRALIAPRVALVGTGERRLPLAISRNGKAL